MYVMSNINSINIATAGVMYHDDQYYKAKAEFHIFLWGVQKIQGCVVVIMCGVAEQATGLKVDNGGIAAPGPRTQGWLLG